MMSATTRRLTLTILLFISLCIALAASAGRGGPSINYKNVVSLTKSNFAAKVLESTTPWLVEFYAPWCGHCQQLAPHYEKSATALKGIFPIGAVNCDEESDLCGMFGIKGFPTIKLFPSEQSPNPHQKGMPWKTPRDYQGARESSALTQFALTHIPNFVQNIDQKNLRKFLKTEIPKAILFSEKSQPPPLFKGLAASLKNRMEFAFVKSSDSDLVKEFNIQSFPSIIVVKSDGERVLYLDEVNVDQVTSFLEKYAIEEKKNKNTGDNKSSNSKNTNNSQEKSAYSVELPKVYEVDSQKDFEESCLKFSGPCFITFVSKEDEFFDQQNQLLQTLSKKYLGQFRFIQIDGARHTTLAETYHLSSGFPSSVLLIHKKKVFVPFIGTFSEASIVSFFDRVRSRRPPPTFDLDHIPAF